MVRYNQSSNYTIVLQGVIEGPVTQTDLTGALFSWTNHVYPKCSIPKLQHRALVGKVQIDLKYSKEDNQTRAIIHVPHHGNKVQCSVLASVIETLSKVSLYSAVFKLRNISENQKDYSTHILKRSQEIFNTAFQVRDLVDPLQTLTQIVSEKPLISVGAFTMGPGYSGDMSDLILVQGRRDVAKLAALSINNTLGLGGLNFQTEKFLELVQRKNLTLMFDGDKGGRAIYDKVCTLLQQAGQINNIRYVVIVPENHSVEDLPSSQIAKLISKKVPYSKYRGSAPTDAPTSP